MVICIYRAIQEKQMQTFPRGLKGMKWFAVQDQNCFPRVEKSSGLAWVLGRLGELLPVSRSIRIYHRLKCSKISVSQTTGKGDSNPPSLKARRKTKFGGGRDQACIVPWHQSAVNNPQKMKTRPLSTFGFARPLPISTRVLKPPQDNGTALIGAWKEVRHGQLLVKPKAFIYYLICLLRRLRSWWNIWFSL